jgi:menaquinone-dependent protoporphyrinogen IX oxidase
MNAIVVYTSKYGSTEKYAGWIAEELGCPVKRLKDVNAAEFGPYDTILYGGGLYAGNIAGFRKFQSILRCAENKKLVLFIVGLTKPDETDAYSEIAQKCTLPAFAGQFKCFALRGDQLFSKMNGTHRFMLRMVKSMTEKKSPAERTAEDELFLESFGHDILFSSKGQIGPILDYIRA